MTDTQSTQMGRGKNARRNKSTASVGSKGRTASTSTIKFQPNSDGFTAFLVVVSRLGKQGQEFTWHDIRKIYHRETQRVLNVEELNAIFCAKGLTKREIFELPKVKRFIVSMDGSMMCRFRLIANPEEYRYDDIPPLMTESSDSDVITRSSASPVTSSQDGSPSQSNHESIAISTDSEIKVGPTSDLSKSEVSPSQISLTHQSSVQSSMTDDEGWVSGKDARSENSSPVAVDEIDGQAKKCPDLDDEVFEVEQRIAAGSDQIDGAVISDVMIVEEVKSEDVFKPVEMSLASPLLVTESVEAAFQAIQDQSFSDSASTTIPETTNVSEQAKVHATPRKVRAPVPAERSTLVDELASGPPIKHLIEKFDTGVNFADHKSKDEEAHTKSIYAQVLEEIGETAKKTDELFILPKKEEHEETEITNVIFRSASTHSSIIAQEQEQLAKFTAEVEAKNRDKPEKPADTTTDETEAAFGVKEQSSMSSLDREYFDSKMVKNEDLFAELGVQDADGFQLKSGSKNSSAVSAQKSASNDSGPASLNLITVIEKNSTESGDDLRTRKESFESDADVPYSLCSEDEAEPMTMIEKSMKVSVSAEQLSPPKEEKAKTVVVNVELDAKAKREVAVDVNSSIKERIAALQAAVVKHQVPIAKVDSIDEKEEVQVLNKSEELEQTPLEVKPQSTSDGSMRRRQVRFMRGCCVVQ